MKKELRCRNIATSQHSKHVQDTQHSAKKQSRQHLRKRKPTQKISNKSIKASSEVRPEVVKAIADS